MGGHPLLERPVRCAGLPSEPGQPAVPCDELALSLVVQLRPDIAGRPGLVVTAGCRQHTRGILRVLRLSWPEDPPAAFGIDQGEEVLKGLLEGMSEDGLSVLSPEGAWVA